MMAKLGTPSRAALIRLRPHYLSTVTAGLALTLCLGWPAVAEPSLSASQKSRANELMKRAQVDWRAGQEHQRDLDYGPIFLWLALHDSDPKAVARWLSQADSLYSPRPEATKSHQLLKIDDDFLEVGLWASRHSRANIRNFGVRMLGNCLGNPSPRAQARVIEIVQRDDHPAVRQMAIHAFWFPVNFQPVVDEMVAESLLLGLQDRHCYPRVAALELCRRTYRKGRKFPDKLEFRLWTRERQLLSDPEPIVVGEAAQSLCQLMLKKKGDISWTYPLLRHSHPFVRGSAAQALGTLAEPASLKKLMTLIEDEALASVTQPVPQDESNIQTASVHHPENRHWSVREFALWAIQQASSQTPVPFVFEETRQNQPKRSGKVRLQTGQRKADPERQAMVERRAKEALTWWEANRNLVGPQD